jgi:hypothetical protein
MPTAANVHSIIFVCTCIIVTIVPNSCLLRSLVTGATGLNGGALGASYLRTWGFGPRIGSSIPQTPEIVG